MELRQLAYFVTTAEELHFGRAAAKLNIAQPSLTQQIQKLERELNVRLLHRNSHQVALTAAGRLFLIKARAALRLAQQPAGVVRVGFVCAAARQVLPAALRRFQRREPSATVALRELWTGQQLASLTEGDLDVAYVFGPVENTSLRSWPVSKEPFVVLLPAAHPLAATPRLKIRDLVREPLILFPRALNPVLYDRFGAEAAEAGVRLDVRHEVSHPGAIPPLVAAGHAIGVVSAARAAQACCPGLVERPLDGSLADTEVRVAWRAEEAFPLVPAFVDAAVTPLESDRWNFAS